MSGAIYASILALTMSVAACSSSEPAPPPSKLDLDKNNGSGKNSQSVDQDDPKTKAKSASVHNIRQNRKQTLDMELGLLQEDLTNAMNNYQSLRGKKYSTLERGIPNAGDPTVQGKLVEAGTSFFFGGLGMALSGIGSAGSAASAGAQAAGAANQAANGARTGNGTTTGTGSNSFSTVGTDALTNGFVAVGDAVSAGIIKKENDKTIKRITGTVEEMMKQWEVEIVNIQAQIDAKQAEIDALVNLGV